MKNTKSIKALLPYILVSTLVTVLVGLTIPKGLFISGGIIIILLFNLIYVKGDGKKITADIQYWGAIISIGGLALLVLFGCCFILPQLASCTLNKFKATTFSIVYFPTTLGFILWAILRLPTFVKGLFKK